MSTISTNGQEPSRGYQLYIQLRNDIVAGEFAPGERLSESSLSRRYGISRTPIREAMARLEHDGLIERYGLIARLKERSSEEIIDMYNIRVRLEHDIAAAAATRRREFDIIRIESAIEEEKRVGKDDIAAAVAINGMIHSAIAAASHNLPLIDLQNRLTLQISAIPGSTLSAAGRWERAHEQHRAILDAIRESDARIAGEVAALHMQEACEIRLAMLSSRT